MGTNYAPSYANLTMGLFEERLLGHNNPFTSNIIMYRRFIDDLIFIWDGDEDSIKSFCKYLKSNDWGLAFISNYSSSQIEYLDLTLYHDGPTIKSKNFFKSVDANSYIHYKSSHHKPWKKNIPYGQLLRIRRNCSDIKTFDKQAKVLTSKFAARHYPRKLINEAKRKARCTDRNSLVHTGKNTSTKEGKNEISFITRFSSQHQVIKQILEKAWPLLQVDPLLKADLRQKPRVSYGATSHVLTDRNIYPTFFRTVRGDQAIYTTISSLVHFFGWTWVGVISSDDDSGNEETQLLTKHLTAKGICVAYMIKLKYNEKNVTDFNEIGISEIIQKSSAKVIILCGTYASFFVDLLPRIMLVLRDKTLIFGPTFASNTFLLDTYTEAFNCCLVVQPPKTPIPDMNSFFESFIFINHPKDMLLRHIWREYMYWSQSDIFNDRFFDQSLNITPQNFSGAEKITDFSCFHYPGLSDRVYNAVYSLAYAIQEMIMFPGGITNVSRFHHHHNQVPRSQCSETCLPGSRKVPRSGIHSCCYDCAECSAGEISNVTDSENCQTCQYDEWPNEKKDRCVPKVLDFLSYTGDIIAVFFSVSSGGFSLITMLILGIFISHRDTAIVKANNRNLSFILLLSIMLSFLCVFLFLGRPVDVSCLLRQICFGILFTVAVSCILGKTIMVYIAFKATKPGSLWQRWIGANIANYVVLLCSFIQVIICVIWLSISPPFLEMDFYSSQGKIIIKCNEGSLLGFYSVLGYMGLLAAGSFLLAFMVKTLPDIFNEAKYITFSMLVFCSVWIAMIPAYLSTRGKYMVAVEIFAILASSGGLLGCIFLPKCFIIFWRPELNSKACLLKKTYNK
ncbi:vomeronasal type-2 receptor 26-like [Hyperolius riggenbachi]|uniref:vomeronasal type-2 receptor 26-like n=1 Tax=Hyperolius riggenbachi TaxID=752182 RepID=UPI0035A2DE9B